MEEINYLRSLRAVRERCTAIYRKALDNKTNHFKLSIDKLNDVADYVISLIKRDYRSVADIKPHTRWRHFEFDGELRLTNLVKQWECDQVEKTRRIIDLTIVSVLLDAGAGDNWTFKTSSKTLSRSEGLAIAAYNMFINGSFSSDKERPHQVDAIGLSNLNLDKIKEGFQVSEENTLLGIDKRLELLVNLGREITSHTKYFESSNKDLPSRPGNLVDYLIRIKNVGSPHDVLSLWDLVINGLTNVWPKTNIRYHGINLGDVWGSDNLGCGDPFNPKFEEMVPFHKLSQWLTYSLIEPIEEVLDEKFINKHLLTGLPEYRNGGLFMDLAVIVLKNSQSNETSSKLPEFEVFDYATVEWRALTVILLDETSKLIRHKLGLTEEELSLAKVLEAGTWKAGREIAAKLRPSTKGPPIITISDGTVF